MAKAESAVARDGVGSAGLEKHSSGLISSQAFVNSREAAFTEGVSELGSAYILHNKFSAISQAGMAAPRFFNIRLSSI